MTKDERWLVRYNEVKSFIDVSRQQPLRSISCFEINESKNTVLRAKTKISCRTFVFRMVLGANCFLARRAVFLLTKYVMAL